jgi:methyl-accepting chemotaxis protein
MIEFKKLKLSTKILIPAILMIFVSNVITTYISSNKMEEMAFKNTRDSLSMLTDSIFITLRNAMNSGNIETIKEAEKNSRENIKGLESLVVAKSKNTIELFSPNEKYTSDKNILEVFDTKKELVIQMKDENGDSK